MPGMERYCPRLGVAVLVWWQGKLLLGKRLLSQGEGGLEGSDFCWQFPGGHIEPGESVFECARREVFEETGLSIGTCKAASYTNRSAWIAGSDYFTLYVSAQAESADAVVKEPEKCADWQWFSASKLPAPLFQPILNHLQLYPDFTVFQ